MYFSSWHALSAIRVRLTAYMYACMTRMRYVTGHSCSLEIFFGVFLDGHLRQRRTYTCAHIHRVHMDDT